MSQAAKALYGARSRIDEGSSERQRLGGRRGDAAAGYLRDQLSESVSMICFVSVA